MPLNFFFNRKSVIVCKSHAFKYCNWLSCLISPCFSPSVASFQHPPTKPALSMYGATAGPGWAALLPGTGCRWCWAGHGHVCACHSLLSSLKDPGIPTAVLVVIKMCKWQMDILHLLPLSLVPGVDSAESPDLCLILTKKLIGETQA